MIPLPDPRWLEILKAGGSTFLAIFITSLTIWILIQMGHLPRSDDFWQVYGLPIVIILSFSMIFIRAIDFISKEYHLHQRTKNWFFLRADQKRIARYLPFMTEGEKDILGWMIHKKIKVLIAPVDGGKAASLLSSKILVRHAHPGQIVDTLSTPFRVPDHVWEVLEKHIEIFPEAERYDNVVNPIGRDGW